jgi:hypothetical protein
MINKGLLLRFCAAEGDVRGAVNHAGAGGVNGGDTQGSVVQATR